MVQTVPPIVAFAEVKEKKEKKLSNREGSIQQETATTNNKFTTQNQNNQYSVWMLLKRDKHNESRVKGHKTHKTNDAT